MDSVKIGKLIYQLRKEKGLTQSQLAEQMRISDKAVSKWERGWGCPELSLLPELSRIFEVDLERLLAGELGERERTGGNMKKLQFYVCPTCGNVITAATDAAVSCCGKKRKPEQPQRGETLMVEQVENEYFITSDHPMEKNHYISFVALLTGDTLVLKKLYPEWGLQARLPMLPYGVLYWYCTEHGLFCQRL